MKSFKRLLLAVLVLFLVATAYIVQEGDTLWDISETHLQNPFLWPDVWEKNPHIVNPHLIYPGDSVALDKTPRSDALLNVEAVREGEDSLTAKLIQPATGPNDAQNDFQSKIKGTKAERPKTKRSNPNKLYVSGNNDTIPRHLNKYLQATAPRLQTPWSSKRTFETEWFFDFEDPKHGLTLRDYDYAILDAGTEQKLQPGDLLEIFPLTDERIELVRDGKTVKFAPHTINAYAEVIHVAKSKARIRILATYGVIDPVECRARKAALPKNLTVQNYQKVTSYKRKEMAEVIYLHKETRPNTHYGWISIGRGAKNGFAPGDGIAIWEAGNEKNKGLPPRQLATGMVVYADEETATVLVRNLQLATRQPQTKDHVSITWKAVVPSATP